MANLNLSKQEELSIYGSDNLNVPMKRTEKLMVRLSQNELQALNKAAQKDGKTPEEFLRTLYHQWFDANWRSL